MAAFVLVAISLALMLFRVAAPYRTKREGTELYSITLTLRERLALQRLNLCALGVLLVLAAIGHWFNLPVELLIIAVAYGIVLIPVRYTLTTAGIGVNQVLFRRWLEFAEVTAAASSVTLIGRPGNGRLRLRVRSGRRQQELLRALRRHVHAPSRISARQGLHSSGGNTQEGSMTVRPSSTRPGRRRWPRFGLALVALLAIVGAVTLSATIASPTQAQTPAATPAPPPPKPDPSGTGVGSPEDLSGVTVGGASLSADDIAKAKSSEPFAYNLAGYVNQNRLAINLVWTLVAGFLVMFMQAGFALVETGFCRTKNAMHVMMTNFMIYGVGMLAFWVCGFAFQEGGVGIAGIPNLGGLGFLNSEVSINIAGTSWGLIGYKGFFLGPNVLDVGVATLFLFQMVFMDTAATILTGAVAERWTWVSFLLWGVFVGGFMYPIFANWAWGGGWLSQLGATHNLGKGYLDFAGSGVVHAQGGLAALAGALVLGARLGKYNKDGSANPMPGHNLNMAALGCFILAFGWFGFNPGSTLGASGSGNLRIGEIATVTMLAGAAASVSAMFYGKLTLDKWDPGYMMNGLLAGLVAITAPSGWVSPISGVIIGLLAGVLVCISMGFFERVLKIDDPVGAISVHGVNGLWGVLALGLFADGTANYGGLQARGLFFGDGGQFLAQIIGVITLIVWDFGTAYIFFGILKALGIFRVKPEDELAGLDLPEMGTPAYPLDPELVGGAIPTPGGGWRPIPAAGPA